jgi:drug/metabolite transporter (DMT)-like permease
MTKTRQDATAGPAALQPAGSARPDRPLQGIALMVAGVFLRSVMDTLTKVAVAELSTPVLIACRTAVVMLLVAPMVVRAGGWTVLRMTRPWGHALRGGLSVCSMLTFFEALRHLPLATTIAICFASPLLMTLMSVPLLRERVGAARWAAVVLGLCGVFVIVGPEVAKGSLGIGAVLALAAAFFYAGAMTCVRWLSSTESDLSMMVSQNAIMGLAGLVGLLFVPPTMPSPTREISSSLSMSHTSQVICEHSEGLPAIIARIPNTILATKNITRMRRGMANKYGWIQRCMKA